MTGQLSMRVDWKVVVRVLTMAYSMGQQTSWENSMDLVMVLTRAWKRGQLRMRVDWKDVARALTMAERMEMDLVDHG